MHPIRLPTSQPSQHALDSHHLVLFQQLPEDIYVSFSSIPLHLPFFSSEKKTTKKAQYNENRAEMFKKKGTKTLLGQNRPSTLENVYVKSIYIYNIYTHSHVKSAYVGHTYIYIFFFLFWIEGEEKELENGSPVSKEAFQIFSTFSCNTNATKLQR